MATGTRSRRGLLVGAVLAILVAALGLTLCGDDDTEAGGSGTSPNSTTVAPESGSPLQKEARQVTAALFGPATKAPAVAGAQGMVDTYSDAGAMQPAVAEILEVSIGSTDILLRWRVKSTGDPLELRSSTFSSDQPSPTASEVALVSPGANELAKPFRFKAGAFGVSCVCSIVPIEINQGGQELTGLYPLFSSTPTEVEVRIPGFPPITGVPVTRRA